MPQIARFDSRTSARLIRTSDLPDRARANLVTAPSSLDWDKRARPLNPNPTATRVATPCRRRERAMPNRSIQPDVADPSVPETEVSPPSAGWEIAGEYEISGRKS